MFERIEKIEDYCANYFFKAQKIAANFKPQAKVLLQFFQRKNNTLFGGINEVLRLLQKYTDTSKYTIRFLPEGTLIKAKEVVLELEGNYQLFGYLEGVIDGILARTTSIASNALECKKAANTKEVIFMGDRQDHYLNQPLDGKAVELAGIKEHSTLAGSNGVKEVVFGSIPHAIIQIFEGDVVEVLKHYQTLFGDESLVALVDFNRDVVGDSLKLLKVFGQKLKGVRIDTSKDVSDKMFDTNAKRDFGITPTMIKNLRVQLDQNQGQHVKIIVSSGFNPTKIAYFEKEQAPVDAYGVGEYILKVTRHFSADAVKINGKMLAKPGRKYRKNLRLITFNNEKN